MIMRTAARGWILAKSSTSADSAVTAGDMTASDEGRAIHFIDTDGHGTAANQVAMTFAGKGSADDTATIAIYGGTIGAPWLKIAEATLTLGSATWSGMSCSEYKSTDTASPSNWVDTVSLTSYHPADIEIANSGNDEIAQILFDATGYQYIRVDVTSTFSDTFEAYIRPF